MTDIDLSRLTQSQRAMIFEDEKERLAREELAEALRQGEERKQKAALARVAIDSAKEELADLAARRDDDLAELLALDLKRAAIIARWQPNLDAWLAARQRILDECATVGIDPVSIIGVAAFAQPTLVTFAAEATSKLAARWPDDALPFGYLRV